MTYESPRRARPFIEMLARVAPFAVAAALVSGPAFARRNGLAATSCDGCHGSAVQAELRASAEPATFDPGDEVVVTIIVARQGAKAGGIYIADPGIGQLHALDQELEAVSGGLVHPSPKNATADGQVSFRFGWRAPSTPGAVHFEIAALSANGDGRSSGDAAVSDIVSFTYGCTAATFYRDLDGDGYGSTVLSPTKDCEGAAPAGYSARNDDCDDAYEEANPAGTEVCNNRDDDCDGVVDEGAPPVELWPDEDGDGYYATRTGTSMVGCVPLAGYAANAGDCAPRDPARHPGAVEICNLQDDNCDGRVDERLHPQCGVGFCRRESPTCEPENCTPGRPSPETCNLLDDDCNGSVDDGATCPAGTCVDGTCVSGAGSAGGAAGSGAIARGGSGGTGQGSSGEANLGGRSSVEVGGFQSGGSESSGSGASRPTGEKKSSAGGCSVTAPRGQRQRSMFFAVTIFALVALRVARTRRRASVTAR